MLRRRSLAAVVAAALFVSQVTAVVASTSGARSTRDVLHGAPVKDDADLQAKLERGEVSRFVVDFAATADLKGAGKLKSKEAKGKFVVATLKTTAAQSQAEARTLVAKTKGARATSAWLTNSLFVASSGKAAAKLARDLARLDGVTAVREEKIYPLVKPVAIGPLLDGDPLACLEEPVVCYGLDLIDAPEAWGLGVTGSGIVVANVDTGVDFEHPALVNQYRGNLGGGTFSHDYNWWDPTGTCGDTPCDNAAHGTHTMGTMVGGDGPGPMTPDIGVAPGARWIAAKGCEDFGCSESSLVSSGEFMLAPTKLDGTDADPSLAPDVVNNSWGGGPGEEFYRDIVTAWRAAGIVPVFSSGNAGPGCDSGGSPGDYPEAFSVGAVDISDTIAEFSSRGPSVFEDQGKATNPNVSAPGVDVVSSVPGGGYEAFSGTSMAAPHTSGAIALVLSSALGVSGDQAMDAVRTTAIDHLDDQCGGADDGDPNNVYGDGRIDAYQAVLLTATGGHLAGTVTDAATNDPIGGAKVTASGSGRSNSAITEADGTYLLFLPEGTWDVAVDAFGYAPAVVSGVEIVTDETTQQDFALELLPRFTVVGTVVTAEDASPLEGAQVKAIGTPVPAAETNAGGVYSLELPVGSYTLRASAGGCTASQTAEISSVTEHEVVTADFALPRKIDDFGHGCRRIPFAWSDAQTQSALFGDEFAGRLRLPFDFEFYGATYSQVFISDNGYLNFLAADQGNPSPAGIPNEDSPNAAIYALWRNLRLGEPSSIEYDTFGSAPNRTFVIEYSDVQSGTTATLDFEVVLHEGGETLDIVYGDNPPNPGDGRGATIGIENATGTDALEFSFLEDLLTPNTAYRYELVPSGVVHGVVTDANDGEPIAGATVSGTPGLVSTVTAADGSYSVRFYPGSYDVTFAKAGYASQTHPVTVSDGSDQALDVALEAPTLTVDPTTISVTVGLGEVVTADVTLSNDGGAPLTWEAKERDRGFEPPIIGAAAGRGEWLSRATLPVKATRNGGGVADALPKSFRWTAAKPAAEMNILVYADDPVHPAPDTFTDQALQALGLSYTAYYDADFDGFENALESETWDLVIFADDQWFPGPGIFDPLAEHVENGGKLIFDSWGVGFDPGHPLFSDLGFSWSDDVFEEPAPIHWWEPSHPLFTFPNAVPEFTDLDNVGFGVYGQRGEPSGDGAALAGYTTPGPDPNEAALVLANDERTVFKGFMDAQNGADLDDDGLLDGVELWINLIDGVGNGFSTDLPWLSENPSSGVIAAHDATVVQLTIGAPDLGPGTYHGQVVFRSDAPKGANVIADVTLTVGLPDEFGAAAGTITDAHSGEPIAGATVTVAATWQGAPYPVVATTAGDGTWQAIGPAGTWTAAIAGPTGYGSTSRDVTIVAGETTVGQDATLHLIQPHATLTGDAIDIVVLQGGTYSTTWTLGNVDGHAPLEFSVFERQVRTGTNATAASALPAGVTSHKAPAGHVARTAAPHDTIGSEAVVFMDVLPWDSDGLLQVLEANGITFDVVGSDVMGDLPLEDYRMVFVSSDQSQEFYDTFASNLTRFEDYVFTGGFLWFGAASEGFGGGTLDGAALPGGVHVATVFEEFNEVTAPDHPVMSGVPNPFSGSAVSHSAFDDVPADATILATAQQDGRPTLIEYELGAGVVLAFGQTLEFAWAFDQDARIILENSVPYAAAFLPVVDLPWLSVTPASGTVDAGASQDLQVAVDMAGLEPGVYQAQVSIRTNDPDNTRISMPVRVVVLAYRQGLNAGGPAVTASDGLEYAADVAYGGGGFGWVGSSSTRSSGAAIDGTDDDALYQDLRTGMTEYRFDVPNGTYRVDLRFAELTLQKAGARVFSVSLEGSTVEANLDVFAAAGGRRVALDRTYVVEVTDGTLDIGFGAQRGDQPIVNAILVTHIPPGLE
jgi:subtilisin family serine protease